MKMANTPQNAPNSAKLTRQCRNLGVAMASLSFLFVSQPALSQNSNGGGFNNQRMNQMLNQYEQGRRPSSSSQMSQIRRPGFSQSGSSMMGSNMTSHMRGGTRGGSAEMLQALRRRVQAGGQGGAQGSIMKMLQSGNPNSAPHMMPGGMPGGGAQGLGMQSGLFAKMMQSESGFNRGMQRNQAGMMQGGMMQGAMRQRLGGGMPGGMMSSLRPGGGMMRPGSMGQPRMGMPAGMMGGMGQSNFKPRTQPSNQGKMTDLEKQMESQYGK